MDSPESASFLPVNKNPTTECAPAQLVLFGENEEADGIFEVVRSRAEMGTYSGDRLRVRDPERYQVIQDLLAEGIGVKVIARLLHAHVHTVQMVRERERESIATLRDVLRRGAYEASRLTLEAIRDLLLDSLDPRRADVKLTATELTQIMRVVGDRAEALGGGPGAGSGGSAGGLPGHSDYINELRMLEADYRERMDLEEGKNVRGAVGERVEVGPARADQGAGRGDPPQDPEGERGA